MRMSSDEKGEFYEVKDIMDKVNLVDTNDKATLFDVVFSQAEGKVFNFGVTATLGSALMVRVI